MTADRPATSFDGDRQKFLGNMGYGSWAAPENCLLLNWVIVNVCVVTTLAH